MFVLSQMAILPTMVHILQNKKMPKSKNKTKQKKNKKTTKATKSISLKHSLNMENLNNLRQKIHNVCFQKYIWNFEDNFWSLFKCFYIARQKQKEVKTMQTHHVKLQAPVSSSTKSCFLFRSKAR